MGGRKKGSKNKTTLLLESNPQAQKMFEELKRQAKEKEQGKVNTEIPKGEEVKTEIPKTILEGVLPSTDSGGTNEQKGEQKTNVPPPGANPADTAKSFSALLTLIGNFKLSREGRELISEMEMETYAKEITPFVTKYQEYLKYVVELQAFGATAMYVYCFSNKVVIDKEKNDRYHGKDKTNG